MIKIGFVGDINPGGTLVYGWELGENLSSLFDGFDIRVGTLESAIGDGNTLCHIKIANKHMGNIIYSPDESISVLKKLNINAVSLANNHACDCDLEGLGHTIEVLEANQIAYFGAGRNEEEASRPATLIVRGCKVGLLGYCYPDTSARYVPSENAGGLNFYSKEKVLDDIRRYKDTYDYLFILPHWGVQHKKRPLYVDIEAAKLFIKEGATAVIGSHTHILQPTFSYKNRFIAMSLGNFLFPDRYIVPPRVTYYPSILERSNKNIPITLSYPIVNKLTYKQVPKYGRYGAVCCVNIDGNKLSYQIVHTYLDSINKLERTKVSLRYRVLYQYLAFISKNTILYRIEGKCYRMLCRFSFFSR